MAKDNGQYITYRSQDGACTTRHVSELSEEQLQLLTLGGNDAALDERIRRRMNKRAYEASKRQAETKDVSSVSATHAVGVGVGTRTLLTGSSPEPRGQRDVLRKKKRRRRRPTEEA